MPVPFQTSLLCVAFWLGLTACVKTEFSGANGTRAPNQAPTEPPSASAAPASGTDCVVGDVVKFTFTGAAQQCAESGRLWNFDFETCTNMHKASFTCSFDEFFLQMQRIKIAPSEKLRSAAAGKPMKALIIGCGESSDKLSIALQWFFVPEDGVSCDFASKPVSITVGCYGKDSGSSAASEDEQKQILKRCMNGA